jgi:hypothetical protein
MRYGRLTLPLLEEHNAEQCRLFDASLRVWRTFLPEGAEAS